MQSGGKWVPRKISERGYAVCQVRVKGKTLNFREHRVVAEVMLDDYDPDLQVDHINGEKLDNRLGNLRVVTNQQNCRAFQKTRGSSQFRGVCWYKRYAKWMAKIHTDNKTYTIGYFDCEVEAAKAYNKAAIHHGFYLEALNPV